MTETLFLLLVVIGVLAGWALVNNALLSHAQRVEVEHRTLRALVYDGCAGTYEKTQAAKKAGMILSSEDKRNIAVALVLKFMPKKWKRELIEAMIDPTLGKTGDGASGRERMV